MPWSRLAVASLLLLIGASRSDAAAVPIDLRAVQPGPVSVEAEGAAVAVAWPDETGRIWTATFSLDPERPLITSIAVGDAVVVSAAQPIYRGETGIRRRGWNAFFDYPPSHPDGTRQAQGMFTLRSARARSVGDRIELFFDGLRMGPFDGGVAYTFFPGSRLVQQEAVLTTYDADVAYYYDAGLEMAAAADRTAGNNMQTAIAYYDARGDLTHETASGLEPERVPVRVRHRTVAMQTGGGSVAVFPAPHQYFFPRDFTSNLGYLWYRAWRGRVALGIRQIGDTNWQFYPWMNAPPGRPQRMSLFLLLTDGAPDAALEPVLRYTNADRFPAMDGYKTLSTHWHLAYTVQALANGFDWTPPFKPVLQAMGVDASIIMDFHGDGHPRDLTDLRLDELEAYFGALRAQSDDDFLLIPSEEANVHLGGHWAVIFPKPVYWFMDRPEGGAFEMPHPEYGTVYSTADAVELLDLVRREGGYMYQTHPRTKGSTGYPDRILATDHFQDPSYLGAGWKAMPSDLSSRRLGDRSLDLLDDLSNLGHRKRIFGEVDVFQFDATHELYAHMNINYVKLDRLPAFDDWSEVLAPLASGEYFTTTGEVLLPEVDLSASTADRIVARVSAAWTFPLHAAEIVWGDGAETHREVIPLGDTGEFGRETFEWSAEARGWTWARVALWDVAGNGAFVNPVWHDTASRASRLEVLLERGEIRVGTTGDYRPFSYRRADGTFEGFDVDAARSLGAALGVRVRFVQTSWPTLVDDLHAGRYDIAMSGITRTRDREAVASLSDGYLSIGKSPLVRSEDRDRFLDLDAIDRPGVRIGVNPGGTNETFVRASITRAQIVVIEDNLSIPDAVATGRVDVMVTDNVEAVLVASQDPRLAAVRPEAPLTREELSYMLPRDDEAFLNRVDAWLRQMRLDGELDRLRERWMTGAAPGGTAGAGPVQRRSNVASMRTQRSGSNATVCGASSTAIVNRPVRSPSSIRSTRRSACPSTARPTPSGSRNGSPAWVWRSSISTRRPSAS